MGKSKRKRKIKEQDFKKVKLKVGKSLPQGQNVTETSFKSRAIVLPTQLSKDGKPTNQRRQTLTDLLSQVCHYSATVRQEAVVGLRDLFQLHEAVLHEHLSSIIHRVAEKFTDVEPTVRQSLLLLLRSIFPLISSERMAPFSALISAHLSCAMTHIYEDIQLDSLSILELYLKNYPELIATNSSQLLQNFVGFITHQSSTGTAQGKGGTKLGDTGKAVITNPKGKFSSQGSRLKVLQQLFDFLKALKDQHDPGHGTADESNDSLKKPTITFSHSKPTVAQVHSHSVNEPVMPTLILATNSMVTPSMSCVDGPLNVFSNPHDLQNFTQTIVPLLLQCWMECNPAEMASDLPHNALPSLTVVTMVTVTQILRLLLQANTTVQSESNSELDEQWFVESYLKDFKQHFMAFFPFSPKFVGLRKGKGKAKSAQKSTEPCNPDFSIVSLNIAICEIMSCFITEQGLQDRRSLSWIEKLQEFVAGNFDMKATGGSASQQLQVEHVQSLIGFVQRIVKLSTAVNIPASTVVLSMEEMLAATYRLYQSSHLMSAVKKVLFKFFASLASAKHCLLQGSESLSVVLEKWLTSLPRMLVQLKTSSPEMTGLVLKVLANGLMRGDMHEEKALCQHLTQFFDVKAEFFLPLGEEIQRSAVELLFHLPSVDDKLLQVLTACCNHSTLPASTRQYLLQVLHYRSPCYEGSQNKPSAFPLPSYLSFLFTVGIGFSQSDMYLFQERGNTASGDVHQLQFDFSKFVILVETAWVGFSYLIPNSAACPEEADTSRVSEGAIVESWASHKLAVKAACEIYRQSSNSGNLLQSMNSALERFLAEFRVLPLKAVHGLICLIKCWRDLSVQSSSPPDQILSSQTMVDLTLACLSYCATGRGAEPTTLQSVKEELLEDMVNLLSCLPPLLHGMLVSLRVWLSGETSEKARYSVTVMMTKLLETPQVKSLLFDSAEVLKQLVSNLLESEMPGSGHDQYKADLKYQFSLFKAASDRNYIEVLSK